MKLVQELFEELETKAKAASVMGERIEMEPDQLLTLITAARGKRESLGLVETGDLKPGYYEYSHTLYMVGHDFRFKGPFETLEEAQDELGISQVEIDQAFFRHGRENTAEYQKHPSQLDEITHDPVSTERLMSGISTEAENLSQTHSGIEGQSRLTEELVNSDEHSDIPDTFEQLHPDDLPEHIR